MKGEGCEKAKSPSCERCLEESFILLYFPGGKLCQKCNSELLQIREKFKGSRKERIKLIQVGTRKLLVETQGPNTGLIIDPLSPGFKVSFK